MIYMCLCLESLIILVSMLLSQERAADALQRGITPAELELYRATKPIVAYSREELLAGYPELSHVQFELDQDRLDPMLREIGERVAMMFQDLPNTASHEDVHRLYRALGFKQEASSRESYDYLFLAHSQSDRMGWDEVRTGHDGNPIPYEKLKGKGFLTSGYAGLGYFFHPQQQPGSRFRYVGTESSKARLQVIAFAQKPESADLLGRITTEETAYPLLFQGLAWVDPDTHQIVRMRVGLLAPRPDLGLYRQDTEIWFREIRFDDVKRGVWLPHEVVVNIEYKNRMFRNRHRYSDYRLFTVETYEKRERPAAAPQP